VIVLSSALRFIFLAVTHRTDQIRPGSSPDALASAMGTMMLMQAYFLPATLLFLVAYGVSHAATVDAVAKIAQGMPVDVGIAYNAIRGRWLRWTGIVLRQFWSLAWPLLPGIVILFAGIGLTKRIGAAGTVGMFLFAWIIMMAAIVLSVINFIRNSLAVAAGVQENLGVNAAMRRSKALVAGRKGRIFLALLMVYALQMVVGAVQLPLAIAATATRGGQHVATQALLLVVQFVTVALIAPVASIAFTFFYIDERVRREGLDIELMMQRSFAGIAPATQGTEI